MLDTLIKIGKWREEKSSEWSRFIEPPQVEWEDKKGNKINNLVAEILFDLDRKTVIVNEHGLGAYDKERTPEQLKALKIQGGNYKSIYATASPKHLSQIFKTFFGKLKPDNSKADRGELMELIDKYYPQFQNTDFYSLLEQLFLLRDSFLAHTLDEKGKDKLDVKRLFERLELSKSDRIALFYVSVKAEQFDLPEAAPFAQLPDYELFLREKFMKADDAPEGKKLCYASGEVQEQVVPLDLTERYSLNKMFVTETKNYARLFDKNAFANNYQVGWKAQGYLDLASYFLLKNYKTKIAGVNHVIVPEFLDQESIDFDLVLENIGSSSELLFEQISLANLDELVQHIELETLGIFWLNFFAFDSDGKYFKTTNLIKDVSKFYFQKLIELFSEWNWKMKGFSSAVDWEAANRTYGKIFAFNLRSVYHLIPVRKDKEKKNKALALMKSILENRKIDPRLIFEYFTELILCHYYGRYTGYKNVYDYSNKGNRNREDYFTWACRDSVFKYLTFFQVLKSLNLIDMENSEQPSKSEAIDKQVAHFFREMGYNADQRAMFFLGRMLSTVTYLQKEKKKTALEKVNFSGMDRDDIVRLRISLVEKAKQYGEVGKVVFHDARFAEHFDFQNWKMSSQEAVFFLLTGYSYGLVPKQASQTESE